MKVKYMLINSKKSTLCQRVYILVVIASNVTPVITSEV